MHRNRRRWFRMDSRLARPLNGNRGAALMVTVVLIFLMLAFLGTWILNGTYSFLTGATVRASALQAHYLACSGLEWARVELMEKKDLDGDGKVGQIGSPDGSVRRPFGGGTLWVRAENKGRTLTLTAYGTYQEITRNVRSIEESPWP